MPWSMSQHWSPRELAQFTRTCTRCGVRIRRQALPGGWQGIDGLFVCFTGYLPVRSDLDHSHEPDREDER